MKYSVSKVPAAWDVLKWAERVDARGEEGITRRMPVQYFVGELFVTDKATITALDGVLYGFLSSCVGDDPESIFRGRRNAPWYRWLEAPEKEHRQSESYST